MWRSSKKVARLISKGDELLRDGDLDGADSTYREAWAVDPDSADAAWSIGCVDSHRGDFEQSLAWAERALDIDSSHQGARGLAGNALLGLERHEQALTHLRIAAETGDALALAQSALCLEELGRPAEAEACLREVLADDPAYVTRHQLIARYAHTPFAADLHHALARVLQAQGKIEEARLHYHLTKRVDPETVLNPIYLEIMSREELEDHPIDALEREPLDGDDVGERDRLVLALLRASSYDELERIVAEGDRDELAPQLTGLIQGFQAEGDYVLSARLRAIIDVVAGGDARELHAAVETNEWQQLLGLAGRVRTGRISAPEAARLAAAFGAPPLEPALLDLVRRFVALDPSSGLVLAELVETSLGQAAAAARAHAALLVARGHVRSGDVIHAEASLERALETAEGAGEVQLAAAAQLELAYICRDRGDLVTAEERLRRSVALSSPQSELGLAGRYALAVGLLKQGRDVDAHRIAVEAAQAAASWDARSRLVAQIATLVATTAEATGQPIPDDLLATLRRLGADGSGLDTLRRDAWSAAAEDSIDEAIELMRRALDEAYRAGSRSDQAVAHIELGQMLAEAGQWAEAREALEQGLARAESEGGSVDRWPGLMTLSGVCQELDDHDGAVEAANRAHREAQRTHDPDREAQSDRHLTFLLLESQPERAIHHAGRWVGRAEREDPDVPEAWNAGVAALEQGRYEDAAIAFERLAAHEGGHRAPALANSARAKLALGDLAGATSAFRTAASAFAAKGDDRRAIRALAELAAAQRAEGEPVAGTLADLRRRFDALTKLWLRREAAILVGAVALDEHEHELAEIVLTEAISIATSEDWRDIEDEIRARTLLGTSYRRAGRNDDARLQYLAAIERASAVHDERAEADLRGRLGIVLRQLGQLDAALGEYDRAIAVAAAHGEADQVAVHKMNRTSVLFELGRDDEGVATGIDAWRAFERQGNADLAARTLVMLSEHAAPDALTRQAHERLEELLGRDAHDVDSAVFMLTKRAAAHWRRGDADAARADMDAALETTRARGERFEEVRALLNRARLFGYDDPEGALADVDVAVALARSLDSIELEVDAWETALGLTLHTGGRDVAPTLRELDRGWTVLRRRLSRDADRVALAGRASEKLKWCAAAYIHDHQDEMAVTVLELARARAFGDLLSETAADETDDWSDALDLAPARSLLAELGDDSVAVGLDVVEGFVVATVIDASELALAEPTTISEDALEALVDDFRSEVITYRGRSAQTWDRRASGLFEPVADAIEGASTVVLLPDGPLNELPLHAVPMADGRRLVAHARIVYAPSLHALSLMRARRGLEDDPLNSIVTVGVAFPDEARAISLRVNGPCLSGRRLDKKAVHDMVNRAKVVHFACHGYFDGQTALDCGLLLSTRTPPALDDVLSVRDVAEWSLQSDLVALSACETGRGTAVPSDFLGLARGFAGVGARSVIASLWPVHDSATQRLMLALYDAIRRQRDSDGHVDTGSALRAAQLECSDAPLPDWAAFKLIGWPEFDWVAAA